MKGLRMGWALIAALSLGAMACGGDDDDDTGGSGACASAQMKCASEPDLDLECDAINGAPASAQSCVMNAADCDAVLACLIAASAGAGG